MQGGRDSFTLDLRNTHLYYFLLNLETTELNVTHELYIREINVFSLIVAL